MVVQLSAVPVLLTDSFRPWLRTVLSNVSSGAALESRKNYFHKAAGVYCLAVLLRGGVPRVKCHHHPFTAALINLTLSPVNTKTLQLFRVEVVFFARRMVGGRVLRENTEDQRSQAECKPLPRASLLFPDLEGRVPSLKAGSHVPICD
ncbi:hypothetical protein E2C01_069273 [Portunus trituberculatus]|uniref:Uncharacterized protein n=1 Tax=Portunus trituberculatus TaxID=210409 RepID=A0A5B7HY39_PORTR|nr:hypothetical protein [Portunus trituberculatus]